MNACRHVCFRPGGEKLRGRPGAAFLPARLGAAVLLATGMLLALPPVSFAKAAEVLADAGPCPPAKMRHLLRPATGKHRRVRLTCSLELGPRVRITKALLLRGREASSVTIDCRGALIDGGPGTVNHGRDMIVIMSRKTARGWSRPENITIRNCRIRGSIRIFGMGQNGEAGEVRASSRRPGHTRRAQAAAPTMVHLENLVIEGQGRIPLYLGPGVTNVTLSNSEFRGTSRSTAIYLDAESARNRIIHNRFRIRVKRELVAVDGSAHNLISGNLFSGIVNGGIHLYRNCGEGGTVRHQAPQYNRIVENRFLRGNAGGNGFSLKRLLLGGHASVAPAVWLGARGGKRSYCGLDKGYPFGSSADDGDHAVNNTVSGNLVAGFPPDAAIVVSDRPNRVFDNRIIEKLPDTAGRGSR